MVSGDLSVYTQPKDESNPSSFAYDAAKSAAKRVFRNQVLFRLDEALPFSQSIKDRASALGNKVMPFTQSAQRYNKVFNVNVAMASYREGLPKIAQVARENYANFGIAKGTNVFSLIDKTFSRCNIQDVANPLSKGLILEAATRTGFMGLAVEGVVSKAMHQYQQTHSLLIAGETLAKEGVKAGISWEAGTAGSLLAVACLPIVELKAITVIAGMALGSVGSKHLLDKIF